MIIRKNIKKLIGFPRVSVLGFEKVKIILMTCYMLIRSQGKIKEENPNNKLKKKNAIIFLLFKIQRKLLYVKEIGEQDSHSKACHSI